VRFNNAVFEAVLVPRRKRGAFTTLSRLAGGFAESQNP
jgi:hypothetical protein